MSRKPGVVMHTVDLGVKVRQISEFKVRLIYSMRFRAVSITQRNLGEKKKGKRRKEKKD